MVRHKDNSKNNFQDIVRKVRRTIIKSSYEAGACHIGSALSCSEILTDIYFNKLKDNDVFIFSKASGVGALYAILAEKGIIPLNKVAFYLKKYPLPSNKVPGVMFSGGSLGHGLPMAVGVALAKKLKGEKGNVYCLISDAEVQEGTFWESMLFKKHHNLDNLKVIVDWNGLQACGKVNKILEIPEYIVKLLGCHIVKTFKGDGVSFMINNNDWHYKNLTKPDYERAILELSD